MSYPPPPSTPSPLPPADDPDEAPVVVAALRSPIGTAGRSLAGVDAASLAAPVLRAVAAMFPDQTVDEVVLGNCMGPGGNIARVSALAAGLLDSVPGLSVDRQCGSGLAAITTAAALVRSSPGMVLAGGTESASTAPWRFWPPDGDVGPRRYERAPFAPVAEDDPDMGLAADLLAAERGVSRRRQDEYAARSHIRGWETCERGGFAGEVIPVSGVDRDDRPRPGITTERLRRLRPTFRPGGTVTAGNACGVNDGAAIAAVVDAATHRRLGVPGLRILATATSGVSPRRPGIGVVPAVRTALHRAAVTLDDIDVVEINEAFAGQVLASCDELGLDPERVCPEGGALALGHPWGASGAVLVVRLFSQLVRGEAGTLGLAAIAVGGGQGVAMVVRRCR